MIDAHIEHRVKNQVIALFNSIVPLGEELASAIRRDSEVVKVGKKVILLDIGAISRTIYFIYSGGLRTYYIDPEGNDISSWFLFENELAISVYSFFSQKAGFEAIETLEECILLRLSYENLMQLYRLYPEFNFVGRTLTEQYYIRSEEKANSLRMLSARDRYLGLLEKRPFLLKRVPLGHLASFLGIAQQSLSRIRSSL